MNYRRAQADRSAENASGQGSIVSHALLPDDPLANERAGFIIVCQDILKSEWDVTKKGIYSLKPEYPKDEQVTIRTVAKVKRLRIGWGPTKEEQAAAAQAMVAGAEPDV